MPPESSKTPATSSPPQAQPPAPTGFPIDTTTLATLYANFCRVTGTPEELILDFGLNTQMSPVAGGEPVKLTHRLVTNYFTAKRLLGALHMAIQQHEAAYGVLEVDVPKRVRQQPGMGGRGFGQS